MLPSLRIVPLESLVVHETVDSTRIARLKKQFRRDIYLKDPPLVAAFGKNKYVVLDGANRFTVSKELKFPHLLVQIVKYNDPEVKLLTWNHAIAGVSFEKWWQEARRVCKNCIISLNISRAINLLKKKSICAYIISSVGQCYGIKTPKEEKVALWILNKLVETYKGKYTLYRTVEKDIKPVKKFYPGVAASVVFPQLSKQDILHFARKGLKIPSGISRHVVPGRALHVNIPFSVLRSKQSTARKNQWLKQFIEKFKSLNRIRYYGESVYLYDEY